MTRGTIAFVDYDKTRDKWILYKSEEFNGDMAPNMVAGNKLLQYFTDIYFNRDVHLSKKDKMFSIVKKMMDDFGYEYDDGEGFVLPYGLSSYELNSDDFIVEIDLTESRDFTGKYVDYQSDLWSKYFNYSDWAYLINITKMDDKVVLCKDAVGKDDTIYSFYLKSNEVILLNFRQLKYTFDQCGELISVASEHLEDKFKIETENADKKDEPSEEADPEEPVKYVEILSQYRDGNRDCLVIRTSDNKHILFKQMN